MTLKACLLSKFWVIFLIPQKGWSNHVFVLFAQILFYPCRKMCSLPHGRLLGKSVQFRAMPSGQRLKPDGSLVSGNHVGNLALHLQIPHLWPILDLNVLWHHTPVSLS